jgi:hypothetical protein
MDNFYVTLPSDSFGFYYPNNIIANLTTKLATPLELEYNKWEFGLVQIYPNDYKKLFGHNTIRLDSQDVIFSIKDYQSMLDLMTNIRQLSEPSKKEKFIRIFSEYFNKYAQEQEESPGKQLFNSCYRENSVKIENNVVSHFPTHIYNGLEDLAETILNPANCHAFRINASLIDNLDYTTPEPVYVYTDIIKPN